MLPEFVIMTVGISFFDKKKNPNGMFRILDSCNSYFDWDTTANGQNRQSMITEANNLDPNTDPLTKLPLFQAALDRIFNLPRDLCQKVRDENLKRAKSGQDSHPDPFPAEISSIIMHGQPPTGSRLILLHSDTVPGWLSGWAIYHLFKENEGLKNWYILDFNDIQGPIRVEGLHTDDPSEFGEKGIMKLGEILHSFLNNHPKAKWNRILDITGGFKGSLPPATTHAICLRDVTVRYLFQESPGHIVLPPLPLEFDVTGWINHRGIIRAMMKTPSPHLYQALPEGLRPLFNPATGDITGVGKSIMDRLDDLSESGSFSPYGDVLYVADLIENASLKEAFKNWLKRSRDIWYGDVIPETIDHARGHATRLLELIYQILSPIKYARNNSFKSWMESEDVFLLLCCLWVHDIGHSGRWASLTCGPHDLSPFPSLIRDLHHQLGYELLTDPDCPRDYGIAWPEGVQSSYNSTFKDLKEAIATLYLFHRREMSFNGSPSYQGCWQWVPNLQESLAQRVNNTTLKERFAFIIALQRIADATDIQSERAGLPEFRTRHKEFIRMELQTGWGRLEGLRRQLESISLNTIGDWVNDNGNYYKELCGERCLKITCSSPNNPDAILLQKDPPKWAIPHEVPKTKMNKSQKSLEGALYKTLKPLLDTRNTWGEKEIILYEYFSSFDRVLFKAIQVHHFEKHSRIESSIIAAKNPFGEGTPKNPYCFEIHLYCCPDADVAAVNETIGEIKKEFIEEVKSILGRRCIKFTPILAYSKNGEIIAKEDIA